MAIERLSELLEPADKQKLEELVNTAMEKGVQYGSCAIRIYWLPRSEKLQVYIDSPSIL